MYVRTCTIFALVFAVLSFISYLADEGISSEAVYLILLAMFFLWLPPRLVEFKKTI